MMALNCTSIYSKEVLHCIDLLTVLVRNNVVTLIWVPGNVGIRGNEKADHLARRGARRVRVTQCSVGIPPGDIKKRTSLSMKEEILKKWWESPGLRQPKRILSDSPPDNGYKTQAGCISLG